MVNADNLTQEEMQEALDRGVTFKVSSHKTLDQLYDASDNCTNIAKVILEFNQDEKLWDWGSEIDINYKNINSFF